MAKINEAYLVSFIVDTEDKTGAITVIKPLDDGRVEAIARITGEQAVQVYELLFEEGKNEK